MNDAETPDQAARRRTLYGRRKGKKLRPGQEEILERSLRERAIKAPAEGERVDPRAIFPDKRALWLEVGFGAGEHLLWQAEHNPDVGIIGCEPFVNGLARGMAGAEQRGLSNVRFLADDARLLIKALPEEVQHVVLVGHNPGMEELASGLCGATPEDVFVRMPTAALAHVAVDASHWSMVRWGAGQLRLLLTPKLLRS